MKNLDKFVSKSQTNSLKNAFVTLFGENTQENLRIKTWKKNKKESSTDF